MQNKMLVSVVVLLGIFISPSLTWAQKGAPPPAGWRACPRCQTSYDRKEAREKYKVDGHAFDPHDRDPHYAVVVNRTSPSSHTRGHGSVLFYAEAVLAHYEALGVPVINGVRAYRFEKSKALQLELFERLGVRYPRAVVVNHREQILKVLDRIALLPVDRPILDAAGDLGSPELRSLDAIHPATALSVAS